MFCLSTYDCFRYRFPLGNTPGNIFCFEGVAYNGGDVAQIDFLRIWKNRKIKIKAGRPGDFWRKTGH